MTNGALITALASKHAEAWKKFDELDTDSGEFEENVDAVRLSAEGLTISIAAIPATNMDELSPKVAAFRKLAGADPTPRIFAHLAPSERRLGESILADLVKLL
jgi:hypothetical protein